MIRLAILVLCIILFAALVSYLRHLSRRAWRRMTGSVRGRKPGTVTPVRKGGKMPTLQESLERLSTLRPQETDRLVKLLEDLTGDLGHGDGARWEIEGHLMADVVDPVLHMLEALRPRDAVPKEAREALTAAADRVQRLRDQNRADRIAAASGEAKNLLERLKA